MVVLQSTEEIKAKKSEGAFEKLPEASGQIGEEFGATNVFFKTLPANSKSREWDYKEYQSLFRSILGGTHTLHVVNCGKFKMGLFQRSAIVIRQCNLSLLERCGILHDFYERGTDGSEPHKNHFLVHWSCWRELLGLLPGDVFEETND